MAHQEATTTDRHSTKKTDVSVDDEMECKEDELVASKTEQREATIGNPLVVVIGIGNFKGQYPQLFVERDYQNVIFAFNYTRGYHIVYFNPKNELIHLTNRANQSKYYKSKNFKVTWNKKEIIQLNTIVKTRFLRTGNESTNDSYDSLIYIISTHGNRDDIIYDSDLNKIELQSIFSEFDNVNCSALQLKPKVFVLDHCRGRKVAKLKPNSLYQDEDEDEKEKHKEKEKEEKVDAKEMKKNHVDTKYNTRDKKPDTTIPVVNAASHVLKIFANKNAYAISDGGCKGGYLIRSFTKVIINDDWFKGLNLNEMILQVRLVLQNYFGVKPESPTQVIDTVSTIPCDIKFLENGTVLPKRLTIKNSQNQAVCTSCIPLRVFLLFVFLELSLGCYWVGSLACGKRSLTFHL